MQPTRPTDPNDPRAHRSRRTFSELDPKRKGLRDRDSAALGVKTFAMIAGGVGFILGGALSVFLLRQGSAPGWVAALCPFLGAATLASTTLWITNSAGSAGSTLYNPSGKTTPPKRQYSQAEAMVVQGRYEDGITAFELAVSEDATDPTPYLRIARVYRDHLDRHEDAVRWFRRALRESVIPQGIALLARKELVELYTHRLGQPERALPELARMASEFEGTDEGRWASGHYADIKARMSNPEPPPAEDPPTTR